MNPFEEGKQTACGMLLADWFPVVSASQLNRCPGCNLLLLLQAVPSCTRATSSYEYLLVENEKEEHERGVVVAEWFPACINIQIKIP